MKRHSQVLVRGPVDGNTGLERVTVWFIAAILSIWNTFWQVTLFFFTPTKLVLLGFFFLFCIFACENSRKIAVPKMFNPVHLAPYTMPRVKSLRSHCDVWWEPEGSWPVSARVYSQCRCHVTRWLDNSVVGVRWFHIKVAGVCKSCRNFRLHFCNLWHDDEQESETQLVQVLANFCSV